ncbi:hypothetical protein K491DRAFT_717751 [Lophiostoma macrostomum CBS 122681]|uniref:Uncharacterized protein n=1 Tax=Lophiostoma macrostomum CBS 122681 TaxID=1314788 RepID=A0A6A6T1M4_9PLEO|nr:hypothetical protein K491DRAFT_717751 [Lophiostoma macrostomum CBS 122681]
MRQVILDVEGQNTKDRVRDDNSSVDEKIMRFENEPRRVCMDDGQNPVELTRAQMGSENDIEKDFILLDERSTDQGSKSTLSGDEDIESLRAENTCSEHVLGPSPSSGAPLEPRATREMREATVSPPVDDYTRNIFAKIRVRTSTSPVIRYSTINERAPLGATSLISPAEQRGSRPSPDFFKNSSSFSVACFPTSPQEHSVHIECDERIQALELRLSSEQSASRARIAQLEIDVLQRNRELRKLRLEVQDLRSRLDQPALEEKVLQGQ